MHLQRLVDGGGTVSSGMCPLVLVVDDLVETSGLCIDVFFLRKNALNDLCRKKQKIHFSFGREKEQQVLS